MVVVRRVVVVVGRVVVVVGRVVVVVRLVVVVGRVVVIGGKYSCGGVVRRVVSRVVDTLCGTVKLCSGFS